MSDRSEQIGAATPIRGARASTTVHRSAGDVWAGEIVAISRALCRAASSSAVAEILLDQVCRLIHADGAELLLHQAGPEQLPRHSRRGQIEGRRPVVRVALTDNDISIAELRVMRGALLNEDEHQLIQTITSIGAGALARALELEQQLRIQEALHTSADAAVEGWARALDLREHEAEGHSRRVANAAVRLGKALGIGATELAHLRRGALLHDIGKIGVPDSILHKPGPLTSSEWAVVRQHTLYANDILAPIPFLRPAMAIPIYHHERWDGHGYPYGLSGTSIPAAARIFALVDTWDAMTSTRPHRGARPLEEALGYIRAAGGSHFDPAIAATFIDLMCAS